MNQNNLERNFRHWPDGKHKFSSVCDTSNRFSSFCRDVILGDKDFSATAFHTGFWIPKDGNIPFRLPTILIPTLETMRWLLQAWITPPQFVIYQATTVISTINNIHPNDAAINAHTMESRLYDFVKNNFPELLDYIMFSFWEKENDMEVVQSICRHVDDTRNMLNLDEQTYFQDCGKKHTNGNVSHLHYTTANTLYNWWYSETPFPEIWEIQEVIPVWGRSETKFFETLLQTQQSTRDIFPLITQVWAFPTYYRNPKWDIQTYEEISEYLFGHLTVHPDIEKDMKILSQYTPI